MARFGFGMARFGLGMARFGLGMARLGIDLAWLENPARKGDDLAIFAKASVPHNSPTYNSRVTFRLEHLANNVTLLNTGIDSLFVNLSGISSLFGIGSFFGFSFLTWNPPAALTMARCMAF
jgi:hypothetical protein